MACSLFIFHKEGCIRQFMLKLATNYDPEKKETNLLPKLQDNEESEDNEIGDKIYSSMQKWKADQMSPISYILEKTTNKHLYKERKEIN